MEICFDLDGGNDGRGTRSSANCATASVRPKPSKLAGELRRGRSGNMEDSVDSMRFGERGLGESSWSCFVSSLLTPTVLDCVIECGDSGVLVLVKNGFDVDAPWPGVAKSKLPRANALLFSDCFLNCSNSGFCSTGIIRGDAAAVERTFDVGGLQLPRMCCAALEEKWPAFDMDKPK